MTKVLPVHPGEHLAEFLEEYEITQCRLAKEIHMPARCINGIVKDKLGISIDTAIWLSCYFGSSPQLWINLQSNFDNKITSKKIVETINLY